MDAMTSFDIDSLIRKFSYPSSSAASTTQTTYNENSYMVSDDDNKQHQPHHYTNQQQPIQQRRVMRGINNYENLNRMHVSNNVADYLVTTPTKYKKNHTHLNNNSMSSSIYNVNTSSSVNNVNNYNLATTRSLRTSKMTAPAQQDVISDKEKFFNTLKSLFAIFDPKCQGYIDINELDVLGANRNEILNEVLRHLRIMKSAQSQDDSCCDMNSTSSLGSCSNSNRANQQVIIRNNRSSSINSNHRVLTNETGNVTKVNESPTKKTSDKIKKLKPSNHFNSNCKPTSINNNVGCVASERTSLVTFDEFIQAAEIVLTERKQNKILINQKQNLIYSKPEPQLHQPKQQQQPQQIQKQHQLPQYNEFISKNIKNYSNILPRSDLQQATSNQQQSNTMASSSSSSSTPTSLSISPSSSSTNNSYISKHPQTSGTTLSQAFETANSTNLKHQAKLTATKNSINEHTIEPSSSSSSSSSASSSSSFVSLNNANSFDLNNLIDKENCLLVKGLENLDLIKQWYVNQLNDNRIKQTNIKKLKHQNLFSIDKMLLDLKQLNDFNQLFKDFLMNKSSTSGQMSSEEAVGLANTTKSLPSYKDYVEQFDLNKQDMELDEYLKKKQERIESLQQEKSSLIRKIFEMKSESAQLAKNIIKLENNQTSSTNEIINSQNLGTKPRQHRTNQPIVNQQQFKQQMDQSNYLNMTACNNNTTACFNSQKLKVDQKENENNGNLIRANQIYYLNNYANPNANTNVASNGSFVMMNSKQKAYY